MSDGNILHPVNYISLFILALAFTLKDCGGSRTRTCSAWQSSRLSRRTGIGFRFTLMPRFHNIVTKSTKSCQRLPIPPYHHLHVFPCCQIDHYQCNAWNRTTHIYHNLNHRADLNGIRGRWRIWTSEPFPVACLANRCNKPLYQSSIKQIEGAGFKPAIGWYSTPPGCLRPPFFTADRRLLNNVFSVIPSISLFSLNYASKIANFIWISNKIEQKMQFYCESPHSLWARS